MARVAASSEGSASAGVKAVGAIVFVVVTALVVLVLVRARPTPEPFDPRSARPDGARGLVLTLQDAGADVTDTGEVPNSTEVGRTRILVLDDRLDSEQRDAVLDFVTAGGVVIVGDPVSTLHGGREIGTVTPTRAPGDRVRRDAELEANVRPGDCTIEVLTGLRGVFVPDGVLFSVAPDQPRCFTDVAGTSQGGSEAFAVERRVGDGVIVGLGDNAPFTNEFLRFADNAGVMVSLLVPERGSEVTFLTGRGASARVEEVGSGDENLRDLVPPWVWMSLALSAVAFVVFAISQSARVGRIVSEPLATPIAGSELVAATGNLMERAGHSSRAGWLLLEQLHRDLCRAHEVELGAPLAELDRAVAQRSGIPEGEVESLLRNTVQTSAGLVALTTEIERIRRIVFEESIDPSTTPASVSDHVIDERVTTP